MNTRGEFKCPSCAWVRGCISPEVAEVQVRQAEAFYVASSKINGVAASDDFSERK